MIYEATNALHWSFSDDFVVTLLKASVQTDNGYTDKLVSAAAVQPTVRSFVLTSVRPLDRLLLCFVRWREKGERVELWEGSGRFEQHKLHAVRAWQSLRLWRMGDERRSRLGIQRHAALLHQVWRPAQRRICSHRSALPGTPLGFARLCSARPVARVFCYADVIELIVVVRPGFFSTNNSNWVTLLSCRFSRCNCRHVSM